MIGLLKSLYFPFVIATLKLILILYVLIFVLILVLTICYWSFIIDTFILANWYWYLALRIWFQNLVLTNCYWHLMLQINDTDILSWDLILTSKLMIDILILIIRLNICWWFFWHWRSDWQFGIEYLLLILSTCKLITIFNICNLVLIF